MPRLISASKILFAAFLLASVPVMAQERETRLRQDVEFLSDSLCHGRATGTTGNNEAAFHIIRRFRDAGLEAEVHSFPIGDKVGHNITAELKGNPSSSRYILVTAFFDGLGELGGRMYPGADSNASGVAGMLELAKSLADSGRNVMFAALDGHNASLAGAAELYSFLKDRKPSMVINLDICGSSLAPVDQYWKEFVMILGGEGWSKSIEKGNNGLGLHIYYDYYHSRDFTNLFYRKIGDQKVFLEHGIPSFLVTSGITMSTNRDSDLPQTLDYPLFAKRMELILRFILLHLHS